MKKFTFLFLFFASAFLFLTIKTDARTIADIHDVKIHGGSSLISQEDELWFPVLWNSSKKTLLQYGSWLYEIAIVNDLDIPYIPNAPKNGMEFVSVQDILNVFPYYIMIADFDFNSHTYLGYSTDSYPGLQNVYRIIFFKDKPSFTTGQIYNTNDGNFMRTFSYSGNSLVLDAKSPSTFSGSNPLNVNYIFTTSPTTTPYTYNNNVFSLFTSSTNIYTQNLIYSNFDIVIDDNVYKSANEPDAPSVSYHSLVNLQPKQSAIITKKSDKYSDCTLPGFVKTKMPFEKFIGTYYEGDWTPTEISNSKQTYGSLSNEYSEVTFPLNSYCLVGYDGNQYDIIYNFNNEEMTFLYDDSLYDITLVPQDGSSVVLPDGTEVNNPNDYISDNTNHKDSNIMNSYPTSFSDLISMIPDLIGSLLSSFSAIGQLITSIFSTFPPIITGTLLVVFVIGSILILVKLVRGE